MAAESIHELQRWRRGHDGREPAGCTVNSRDVGASASNATGLNNAMAPINTLDRLANGVAKVSSGGTLLPTAEINTLSDVLHDCVGSAGVTSTACHNLFTCAVPGAKSGAGNVAPVRRHRGDRTTDTLAATLDIVRNPVNNVAVLFTLVSKTPPYLPKLARRPTTGRLRSR